MKAKKALGMALALASALFFFACSNMDSGSVDNGAAYLYSAQRTLTISVDGVELSDGSGTAVYDPWINRTVLPAEAYSLDPTTSPLTLVLKSISNGKTVRYDILTKGTVNTSDSKKTDFQLTLDAASYDFWLYAYKTADFSSAGLTVSDPPTHEQAEAIVNASDINNNTSITTVYWAHGAKDLTNGVAANTEFTLTPIDLTGSGNINIGGAFWDPDGIVAGIKIGVYNIYTNEVIEGKINGSAANLEQKGSYTPKRTATTPNYFGKLTSTTFAPPSSGDISKKNDGSNGTHIIEESDAWTCSVPAGSYRLAVAFYSDGGCTKEVGYWSDLVIVEPTNKSNNLDIEFSGINTRPAAPTGLTASLVKDTYKKEGQVNGKFDVELKWKDNASNEKGYLIRVAEYVVKNTHDALNESSSTILGFTPASNAYDVDAALPIKALTDPALGFYTQTATAKTNLLLSQCESVILTLDTGKLYDFEVVAYNAIGYSEYVPGYTAGGAGADTKNAVTTDGFGAYGTTDTGYNLFIRNKYWTPRKLTGGAATFDANGRMEYKQAAPEAADPATAGDFTQVTGTPWNGSGTAPSFDNTATYYTSPGTNQYEIAYITEFAKDTAYYTLAAGKGKPYTPFKINLFAIEFNFSGGKLYQESKVLNGNYFNFYRFGNDTPSLKNAFGAVVTDKLSSVTPLTNPVTADDITPTDAGSASEPFIVKWNPSNSAYSNWKAWYRQSQTKDGTTKYYKTPKVPADILKFNEEDGYGNQVVYATYAGNESPLTIVVGVDAANSAEDIQNGAITSEAVAENDGSTLTGKHIDSTKDAKTEVWVAENPNPSAVAPAHPTYRYLYLKLDTSGSNNKYTAVKYYINRVEQSNIDEDGCYVDLMEPTLGDNITVMICGYIGGRWYSRSFSVSINQ